MAAAVAEAMENVQISKTKELKGVSSKLEHSEVFFF